MPFQKTYNPKFDFDVKFKLSVPERSLEKQANEVVMEAVKFALTLIKKNFEVIIINPLLYGGKGWYGIVNTQTWKWLGTPAAWGQLGFTNPAERYKLLKAYKTSWTVKTTITNKKAVLDFNFGDEILLRKATIHPAAGTRNLPKSRSWLDWLYEGIHFTKEKAKFKKTGPRKGVRSSKIAGPYAGRMIKFRKEGSMWEVKPKWRLDMDYFMQRNSGKIQSELEKFMTIFMQDYFK